MSFTEIVPLKNVSPVGLWYFISVENKSSLTQDVGSFGVGPGVGMQGLHHVDSDYLTRHILYSTIHMDQGLISSCIQTAGKSATQ